MDVNFKDLWAPSDFKKAQKSYVARAGFMNMMRRLPPTINLGWPNYAAAPWHLQIDFENYEGYREIINVWPHRKKWQRDGEKSKTDNDKWQALEARIIALYTGG